MFSRHGWLAEEEDVLGASIAFTNMILSITTKPGESNLRKWSRSRSWVKSLTSRLDKRFSED